MGEIEKKSKRKKLKTDIQRAILTTIKTVGFVSLAVLAPNAVQYLEPLGLIPGKRYEETIKRSRERLVKAGLLKYENGLVCITKKGEIKLGLLEIKDNRFDKLKKWDGRWRMLIFDIPEKRRSLREKIRLTLTGIGFMRLQDSVWIYPYSCEDLVSLLKADFRVGKDLLYLIVDSIESDKNFRKSFGLSLEV